MFDWFDGMEWIGLEWIGLDWSLPVAERRTACSICRKYSVGCVGVAVASSKMSVKKVGVSWPGRPVGAWLLRSNQVVDGISLVFGCHSARVIRTMPSPHHYSFTHSPPCHPCLSCKLFCGSL